LQQFWPTQAFNVYGHDPIGVGLRGLPVGFAILAGACINLVLLSVLKGHIRMLMIISSVLMTAGCGSLAVAEVNNMYQLWGLLILAGIGIGGKFHFAPHFSRASRMLISFSLSSRHRRTSLNHHNHHLPRRPNRNRHSPDPLHPRHRRLNRVLRLLQRLPRPLHPRRHKRHRLRHGLQNGHSARRLHQRSH
jgi:hypothetical protein